MSTAEERPDERQAADQLVIGGSGAAERQAVKDVGPAFVQCSHGIEERLDEAHSTYVATGYL